VGRRLLTSIELLLRPFIGNFRAVPKLKAPGRGVEDVVVEEGPYYVINGAGLRPLLFLMQLKHLQDLNIIELEHPDATAHFLLQYDLACFQRP
jgi:hypothetical protein